MSIKIIPRKRYQLKHTIRGSKVLRSLDILINLSDSLPRITKHDGAFNIPIGFFAICLRCGVNRVKLPVYQLRESIEKRFVAGQYGFSVRRYVACQETDDRVSLQEQVESW